MKNHINAFSNPYAQKQNRCSIEDVRNAVKDSWPLTRVDICVVPDGAATAIRASEDGIKKLEDAGEKNPRHPVRITGIRHGMEVQPRFFRNSKLKPADVYFISA